MSRWDYFYNSHYPIYFHVDTDLDDKYIII